MASNQHKSCCCCCRKDSFCGFFIFAFIFLVILAIIVYLSLVVTSPCFANCHKILGQWGGDCFKVCYKAKWTKCPNDGPIACEGILNEDGTGNDDYGYDYNDLDHGNYDNGNDNVETENYYYYYYYGDGNG